MSRQSKITADEQDRMDLRALAKSAHRGEADHTRGVLLTLDGGRAAEIATTLGVHISSVQRSGAGCSHTAAPAL
jgi:hypothetical protein